MAKNPRGQRAKVLAVAGDHKPGADQSTGEAARRLAYQEFAFEKHIRGYTLRDIAKALEEHYFLEVAPSLSTVTAYIKGAVTHRKESIADKRDAYVAVTLPRLEQIIRNFLPIASGEGPNAVIRHRSVNGVPVEVIDEDGFKEAKEAAEVVIKVAEQARRILGVGIDDKGKDESKTLTEARANTLIIQTVNNHYTGKGSLKHIGAVEMTSGDANLDALEAGGSI